jgi:2-C-methyl-D-erythritol 4-phosphate cytidylyltransferase
MEANGVIIHLVEGEYTNLKITTPEDLLVAESILEQAK